MTDEDWPKLGRRVLAARRKAGYSNREDLAGAVGVVSSRTLGTLERGRPINRTTLGLLEEALGWAPGSAGRVLAGGEPVEVGEPYTAATAPVAAAIAEDPALLPEAKAHLLNQYELLLRLQAGPADQTRRQQDRRDTAAEDRRRLDEELNAEAAADMAEAHPTPEVGEPTQIAPRNRRSRHLR